MAKPKKKIKEPFVLKLIKTLVPIIEKISPRLAGKFSFRLFFYPFRFPHPKSEMDTLNAAKKTSENIADKEIVFYEWGASAKTVLMIHGWSGRATQFRKMIPAFVDQGYKVVAVDLPAHGKSSGKSTNIFEINEVFIHLTKHYPEFDKVVTHSFGGVAIFYAIMKGFKVKNLVTISAPVEPDLLLDEFFTRINGTIISKKHMLERIVEQYGQPFYSFSVVKYADQIKVENFTIIHDSDDTEAEVEHAHVLRGLFPKAVYKETSGLGHNRILKDEGVITQILSA